MELAMKMLLCSLLFLVFDSDSFSIFPHRRHRHHHVSSGGDSLKMVGLLVDSIDLTPFSDGGVMKTVTRSGDSSYGYPVVKDVVGVAWTFKLKDGSVTHRSTYDRDDPFTFTLGSEKSEVIQAWELCVPTMAEGEIAELTIQPAYGFGKKGAPPMVPPNEVILCELELISVTPSVNRAYESVGYNESIKDELMEKIEAGDSLVSNQVVGFGSDRVNGTKSKEDVKMFDDKTMKVDPMQRVMGEGRGHCWEETTKSIDVEVAIPTGASKSDIIVDIQVSKIRVELKNGISIIEGPLHGRVIPEESMWAMSDHDPKSRIKGTKLVLSLEKTYESRDIWATVFDRDYIRANQPEESNSNYNIRTDGNGDGGDVE